MAEPKLVFVEGMTGAGKSTTAGRIEEFLVARGERVRRYHEMDDDNPIRTKGVDAMRSNHPQTGRLPDVGEDGFARDPAVYAVEQWGALAQRCHDGPESVVLESRYMQNSVQPRYLAGAPTSKVIDGFVKICEQVAPAAPLLVYLRPADVETHLRRTLDSRPAEWSEWLVRTFGSYGWARSRGLSGQAAVVGFYQDWEEVAAELFELHPGRKLRIIDPHDDWDDALEQIFANVRTSHVASRHGEGP